MSIYSASDAAADIGCDSATVRRACATHGIGTKLGRDWALTGEDIVALRGKIRGKPGNPNFLPGNYFGKPRKPAKKKSRK